METPTISIVIPTHNRCRLLRQLLDGLQKQTYPLAQIEVVVVADSCTDDTATMVQHYAAPYPLHFYEHSARCAAVTRNLGASHAAGPLLLFLDDDIEPSPSLVEAHVRRHAQGSRRVVIGYLPVVGANDDFFQVELRSWWAAAFMPMTSPGYRFAYTDLLSGNVSMESSFFNEVGGFDVRLRCREDYELGMRLIEAGAEFHFAPDALGHHHEMTDLRRSLRRKYDEGQADMAIGQRYPELRSTFLAARLMEHSSILHFLFHMLVFILPRLGDWLAASVLQVTEWLEHLRLRSLWRWILDGLLAYWYWRGIADSLGSWRSFRVYMTASSEGNGQREVRLDLRSGLVAVATQIDAERPHSAQIWYGDYPIGHVPAQPGREQLRSVHLRRWLVEHGGYALTSALAAETVKCAPVSEPSAETSHAADPGASQPVQAESAQARSAHELVPAQPLLQSPTT